MTQNIDPNFVESVLFNAPLYWEVDPERFLWLRALHEGQWIRMKINGTFPDNGSAYSLLLSNGNGYEFDDMKSSWTRGPLEWPETAQREEREDW